MLETVNGLSWSFLECNFSYRFGGNIWNWWFSHFWGHRSQSVGNKKNAV